MRCDSIIDSTIYRLYYFVRKGTLRVHCIFMCNVVVWRVSMQKDQQHTASQKSETALREEAVLQQWNEQQVFEKTLAKDAPQGEFVFYDGPPFATGLPHWGSLLSSISKDVFGRYKTMRGYRVPRRWGWDCHGLPIETMVEKKLNLKTKKDIEAIGIDTFNEEARNSVLTYVADWKRYVERIGRWVDFDHSYKTMDNAYIESVWWALAELHKQQKLYEGRKVLMYCPRCETPLSKAEIAMDNSYKDVTDEAVYVKFHIQDSSALGVDGDVYFLVWTTTPWTLPANVALALGADIAYVLAEKDGECLVLAESRVEVLGEEWKIHKKVMGTDLVSTTFVPLYAVEKNQNEHSHKVYTADFVTTEDGSGIVHIAPVYGEDDYNIGKEHDLPMVPLLDASGNFNNDAPEFVRGMYFKKGGKYVVQDLENRELLFKKHQHTHSYPHCYRCSTALIYNALTSWFIDIQSVKQKLLEKNNDITWHPAHLKEGRFKHILENAPDWTISRNRFWASPLPIWKHEKTGEVRVFGSLKELRAHTKRSGNTYLAMRHGEAESNVRHIVSSSIDHANHLTERGREQVRAAAAQLREKGITKIITSPLLRTKETAAIVAEVLDISDDAIVEDVRLREWQLESLDKKPLAELRAVCPALEQRFLETCGTGETLLEMRRRVGEAIYSIERTYTNEAVLIVAHEYVLWFLECVAKGYDVEACIAEKGSRDDYAANAEVRPVDFVPLPHNKEYELDVHRPYIDDLELVAEDGARLVRIPEVVDCWVESGAMPFASEHYPHEHKDIVERRYPGDFIAEYIAQTRTWFYYMHAMGVLLFGGASFKHCVTTGNVLAADGSKMSKSKNNYTDPLNDMDVYGADAARLYLLGSVVMQAEDSAFKQEELREAHNRYINMLWNTYQFYTMQDTSNVDVELYAASTHVLDRWVLIRLEGTVAAITELMDAYDTVRTARLLRDFVSDLSTWYVRRSRDRLKGDDAHDKACALSTLRHVLEVFARLTAPITPFIAESVYNGVGGTEESVHLADWPESGVWEDEKHKEVLQRMMETQRVVSEALDLRTRAGIKVRQPLVCLTVPNTSEIYADLVADEVNVKDVVGGDALALDTNLTEDLLLEGDVRELVRAVQGMRKEMGLSPEDGVVLTVQALHPVLDMAHPQLQKVAGVQEVRVNEIITDGKHVVFHDDTALLFVLVVS
jgi:isoleucyl-tRNA synthetase